MSEKNQINLNIEKDFCKLVNQTRLKYIVNTIFNHFNKNGLECTISIVEEKKIRELNNAYRSINLKTDVLSFSAHEINPETRNMYIGDVIISYPVAKEQSKMLCHTISEELDTLTIHGVLHLLGYDHETKKKEIKMFAVQSNLLNQINEHF